MPIQLAAQGELQGMSTLMTLADQLEEPEGLLEYVRLSRVSNKQYIAKVRYVGDDEVYVWEMNSLPVE